MAKETKTDAELEAMIGDRIALGGVFVSVRKDPLLGWRATVITAPKRAPLPRPVRIGRAAGSRKTRCQQKDGNDEDEDDDEEKPKPDEEEEAAAADVKGIPEFWLSAMKNSSLAETITDRDEEVLKDLTDIRMEYLDRPGFRLIFEFAENAFFTNKTLSKTYYYQEENGYGGDFIYDHAEGEKIDWKDGQDLTVKVESKKQRNKSMSFLC